MPQNYFLTRAILLVVLVMTSCSTPVIHFQSAFELQIEEHKVQITGNEKLVTIAKRLVAHLKKRLDRRVVPIIWEYHEEGKEMPLVRCLAPPLDEAGDVVILVSGRALKELSEDALALVLAHGIAHAIPHNLNSQIKSLEFAEELHADTKGVELVHRSGYETHRGIKEMCGLLGRDKSSPNTIEIVARCEAMHAKLKYLQSLEQ